jgi:hypothetical protein
MNKSLFMNDLERSEEVVRRRFDAGLRNFQEIYRELASSWVLYDNSGPEPRFIESGDN